MDGHYMSLPGGIVTAEVSGYRSQYSFDANGNFITMENWSAMAANIPNTSDKIDDLKYWYLTQAEVDYDPALATPSNASNRLSFVEDPEGTDADYGDIDTQTTGNYTYDEIGQLLKDTKEGITNISWTVTNKVREVTKDNGDVIHFDYNALGNRISKQVLHQNGNYEKTFYILDAQGNVMSTYEPNKTDAFPIPNLYLADRNIYGSSRVGMEQVNKKLTEQIPPVTPTGNLLYRNSVGDKQYELANLPIPIGVGNVLNVVTDRKLPFDSNANLLVDYSIADVKTYSDYYPYGMQLPNRKGGDGDYRYGFNGMEKDNELKPGDGNSLDYGDRMYDSRIGRWFSIDGFSKKFPWWTPYQFCGNSPIWAKT